MKWKKSSIAKQNFSLVGLELEDTQSSLNIKREKSVEPLLIRLRKKRLVRTKRRREARKEEKWKRFSVTWTDDNELEKYKTYTHIRKERKKSYTYCKDGKHLWKLLFSSYFPSDLISYMCKFVQFLSLSFSLSRCLSPTFFFTLFSLFF